MGMANTRRKTPISLALDPEILSRIEAWINEQDFPPSKTAVFEMALKEFLDGRQAYVDHTPREILE